MSKIIINLGIKKGDNNVKSSPLLSSLQDSLPMSTAETPEKGYSA